MADDRVELCERRSAAPVDPAEIAAARAGSREHARRWAMAGQDRVLECLAAEARCAIVRRRATVHGSSPQILERTGAMLFFYRSLALRYRDAAAA